MTGAQWNSRHRGLFLTVVFFTILVVTLAAAAQEEEITVSCYKGNLDEGNNVGTVTVTKPEDAGPSCNSTYYDCQGQCLGCFPDKDLDRMVCYDNTGNKALK